MAETIPAQIPPARKPLTQERLIELLRYDPETGIFTWRSATGRFAGKQAGYAVKSLNTSYVNISVDGRKYRANTLAWLYMNGEIFRPTDHKDGDGLNNRILNIRKATHQQNCFNQRMKRTSRNGLKGIARYRDGVKWMARIRINGKQTYLGIFRTKEDAHAAYCAAAVKFHGEFARTK